MLTSIERSDTRLIVISAVVSLVMALGVVELETMQSLDVPMALMLAVCALPWLTVLFCTRPLVLAFLWLLVLFYEQIVHDAFANYPTLSRLGNVLLLPMDIPYFFTLTYISMALVQSPNKIRRFVKDYTFLALFLTMILVSVIIYTPEYGKMSIGEARKFFFFFFFPVLAFISIKSFADLHKLLMGVFFLSLGVSILGYALLAVGPATVRSTLRPISASGALTLLFALFSILITHANGLTVLSKRLDNGLVGVFLPLIVVAHHRTVFLAGFVGLCLLVTIHPHKLKFVVNLLTAILILFTLTCIGILKIPRFNRIFLEALSGITDPQSDHTASWRMQGWAEQLSTTSQDDLLVGKGLGSYYTWYYGNQKVTVDPHDAYVQIILKFGMLGLMLYVLLAVSFFRRMFAARKRLPRGPARAYIEVSIVTFAAAQAYMIGYGFDLIILVLYAIGITALKLCQDGWRITEQRQELLLEDTYHPWATE